MENINIEVYTIKEKKPNDGDLCWVKPKEGRYNYQELLTFNEHYNVWDDSDGDDYYCDVNEEDKWFKIPIIK